MPVCVCVRACVCAGKKNKLRLYYLSWLRNKILHNDPEVEKRQGWTSVGDLEGCVHYKVGEEDTLLALPAPYTLFCSHGVRLTGQVYLYSGPQRTRPFLVLYQGQDYKH